MNGRPLNICVLGGTGFVGTELVTRLARAGHSIRVPTRRALNGRHLGVLPTVEVVTTNLHDPTVLGPLFSGTDAVVNLIGILNEHGKSTFRSVHVDFAVRVIEAMRAQRVSRLLHMSSLGASPNAPSQYLRSKAEAEAKVRAATTLSATIFKPSVIFGPRDTLTNRFAGLLRLSAGVMPLARPKARFAPIYVNDVVEAFLFAIANRSTVGQTYELCGPDVMTLAELVRQTAAAAELPCHIIPLPDFVARLQGAVMGLLPGKPFSLDNYRSLTIDSVCQENGCGTLGIKPTSMAVVAPGWLNGRSHQRRLDYFRRSY